MLSGSMVALVTPFRNDHIDVKALQALVEFHVEAGTKAIIAAGTTGESGTLSHAEKLTVIKTVIDAVNGRLPVIAGTACQATKDCIELTAHAKALGAHAALIMTPAYIKPTQEGLFLHYSHVAKAVALPIILYNVPTRTASDLLPETVAKLAKISNIVGIKDATADLARLHALKSLTDHFAILSGDDLTGAEWILTGATGIISVTANVVPHFMAKLVDLCLNNNQPEANRLQQTLMPLHQTLFCESNPIPVKWALSRMGRISEEIRLPLTPLTPPHQKKLETILCQLSVLQ